MENKLPIYNEGSCSTRHATLKINSKHIQPVIATPYRLGNKKVKDQIRLFTYVLLLQDHF